MSTTASVPPPAERCESPPPERCGSGAARAPESGLLSEGVLLPDGILATAPDVVELAGAQPQARTTLGSTRLGSTLLGSTLLGSARASSLWSRVRRFWPPRLQRSAAAEPLAASAPREALPSAAELARFVYGLSPEEAQFREAVKSLLASAAFERRNGLTMDEQAKLSYERFKLLRDTLDLRARDVIDRPARLTAVLELVGAVDGTLFTVMSIHYCLCVGSILRHGSSLGRASSEPLAPELARYLEELDSLDSIGTFLVTELGYGNNVVSLETRAEYDSARRELRLTTPSQLAAKFMPNTGVPGVPKIGVVMARLIVQGCDHGVFPVVVRLRTATGACPGVSITPLGEKPGYALDNAMTAFHGIRVSKQCLLLGSDSRLSDDGVFESRIKSRRERFLSSMEQVQLGRIGLSAVGATLLGASSLIAIKYAAQRKTFAPRHADVSVLEYRNHQRDVFTTLAYAYASRLMVRDVMMRCVIRSGEHDGSTNGRSVVNGGPVSSPSMTDDHDTIFRISGATKVHVSYAMERFTRLCRERCGAAALLEENRLSTYAAQAQGLITAEGDNQIVLIKIARQMLLGHGYTKLGKPKHDAALELSDPRRLIALLRSRERHLHGELKRAMAPAITGRDLFSLWNDNINVAIEMATAHASRLVMEAFWRRVQPLHPESPLRDLLSLFGLQEIAPHLGYFLAEGWLAREEVRLHGKHLDRLCARLQPRALYLAQALDVPNELLRAPIASDDYVADYAARMHVLPDISPDISPAAAPASVRRAPDGSRRWRSGTTSTRGFTARTGLTFSPAEHVQAEGRPETRDASARRSSFRSAHVASGRH